MKNLGFLGVGALVGFAAVYFLVPLEETKVAPPAWFSLPGRPLAVNGTPVDTWEEANVVLRKELRRAAKSGEHRSQFYEEPGKRPTEVKVEDFRVEYVPDRSSVDVGAPLPKVVVVRAWEPVTVEYSRAWDHSDYTRFELVRPDPIE